MAIDAPAIGGLINGLISVWSLGCFKFKLPNRIWWNTAPSATFLVQIAYRRLMSVSEWVQTDWLLMNYPVFIRLTKKLRSWRLNSELYVVGCIYVVCRPPPSLPNYLSCRRPPPPPTSASLHRICFHKNTTINWWKRIPVISNAMYASYYHYYFIIHPSLPRLCPNPKARDCNIR